MIKDVSLDGLVAGPGGVAAIGIDFDWQSNLGWLPLADEVREVISQSGVDGEISFEVGPECAYVCKAAAIDERGVDFTFVVILFDFQLLLPNVIKDQLDFLETLDHFRCADFDAMHVDEYRPLDTTSTSTLHVGPITKGLGKQGVGRNRADCLVEIPDLHGI